MYKYTQFQIKIVDFNKIYHKLENLQMKYKIFALLGCYAA